MNGKRVNRRPNQKHLDVPLGAPAPVPEVVWLKLVILNADDDLITNGISLKKMRRATTRRCDKEQLVHIITALMP